MRASTEKNGEIGIANCLCDYVLSGIGTIRSIHLHVQCTSAAIVFTIDLMIAKMVFKAHLLLQFISSNCSNVLFICASFSYATLLSPVWNKA